MSVCAKKNENFDASKLFSQLKSLVGVWKKEGGTNSKFYIDFELTANETVLIETWYRNNKKHSLTLYHLNGNDLIATHYCPQGNQPRLQLSMDSTSNNISFQFLDITNLGNKSDSYQHSLGFEINQSFNKVIRREIYLSQVGEEASVLKLIRQ